MTLPTLPPSLRSDYALIADAHQKFLAKRGVLLPAEDTQFSRRGAVALYTAV